MSDSYLKSFTRFLYNVNMLNTSSQIRTMTATTKSTMISQFRQCYDETSTKSLKSKRYLYFPLLILLATLCPSLIECASKGGNLDECVNTNVLCYECDSRYDANCADPFGEGSIELSAQSMMNNNPIATTTATSISINIADPALASLVANISSQSLSTNANKNNSSLQINSRRKHRQLPPVQVCHGCCVKLTSKLTNGVPYVKRMCISNLSINYFMVGLVCMKESGDRGKLCFCETDYCNGQDTKFQLSYPITMIILLLVTFMYSAKLSLSSNNYKNDCNHNSFDSNGIVSGR